MTGLLFYPCTLVSSINKTDRHNAPFILSNAEEYVKRGESTLKTSSTVFSLHHSATVSYHFDKIFTPNALEIMSNCTRMTGHSWSYRLLNVKLTIFFVKFQVWWHQIQCNAQSFADHQSKFHNLKASPFRVVGVLKGTIIEKWTWLTTDVWYAKLGVTISFEITECGVN